MVVRTREAFHDAVLPDMFRNHLTNARVWWNLGLPIRAVPGMVWLRKVRG